MGEKFRRRNYFVLKSFQTRYIIPFFVASLLANVIAVTLFIYLAKKKINSILFSMSLPHTDVGALLSPVAFVACIVAAITVSLLFLLVFQAMYRKIEGSLHHISVDLHKIADGDLGSRVILRENDEFREFAGNINIMAEEFNSRFKGLKDHAEELVKATEPLRNPPATPESSAARQNMRRIIKSMEDQIQAFKL